MSYFDFYGTFDSPLLLNRWEELPRAIGLAQIAGATGLAELLRALRDGKIALLPILPDASHGSFKRWATATAHRPAVALVGDDDGANRGPDGWRTADQVLRWARCVLVHAAGAEVEHYHGAIVSAQLHSRVLIIECNPATMDGWLARIAALLNPPPTLVILPRGGVHPLPPTREEIH